MVEPQIQLMGMHNLNKNRPQSAAHNHFRVELAALETETAAINVYTLGFFLGGKGRVHPASQPPSVIQPVILLK